jgi:Group II intron, maturase-specific domain
MLALVGSVALHIATRPVRRTALSIALLRVEHIVEEINRFLRGWAGYFRYGNSALRFEKIRSPAAEAPA